MTILTILLHTYCSPIMYTRKRQACMDNVLTDDMHRVLSYILDFSSNNAWQ